MLYAQLNDFCKAFKSAEEATGNYSDEVRINQFYMETSKTSDLSGLTLWLVREASLSIWVFMCFRWLMILVSRVSYCGYGDSCQWQDL